MRVSPFRDAPPARQSRPALFIDKNGVLVADVAQSVDPARVEFIRGAAAALHLLERAGYLLVIVSHQPGLALGLFERPALQRLEAEIFDRLRREGVTLTAFHACPHAPGRGGAPACACRMPAAGLLLEAAADHGIDLTRSWMIADLLDGVEAGHRAGCRSVLLDVGSERSWDVSSLRMPSLRVPDLSTAAEAIAAAGMPPSSRSARRPQRGATGAERRP